ncbi:TPA: DNA replication protein DnaD [Enterococcus faecium]
MAEKRMLAKSFLNNASFMKMSDSAKLLYVYLNTNADDDGIVEAYPYMKMLGTPDDDVKILFTKGFVFFLNEDLLTFLPHWLQNQNIRIDRYKPSIYRFKLLNLKPEFFSKLKPVKLDVILKSGQVEPLRGDLMEKWYPAGIPSDVKSDTQLSQGQNSQDQTNQDKDSIEEINQDQNFFFENIINQKGIEIITTLGDRYTEVQREKYLKLIASMKDSIEREYKIEIRGQDYFDITNKMLTRLFNSINEKLNLGEKIDEMKFINTTARNHWEDIAKQEKASRQDMLEALKKIG